MAASARVEVFAPARADLAGGTLDLWPLYCFHPGSVTVNVSLGAGVRVAVEPTADGWVVHETPETQRHLTPADAAFDLTAAVVGHFLPEGGIRVRVLEQLPVGSGLGGSSVYAVALARGCLALSGRRLARRQLVAILKDLEAKVLGAPTGVQDYYPALIPGVLAIRLLPGGERVQALRIPKGWVASHLAVVFTGVTHHSGMVNWQVYRARVDGDPRVGRLLEAIGEAARDCLAALEARNAKAVGRAVAREWQARRKLAPEVAPPELEDVLAAGLEAGAWAAKACGAGGGGSVLFWAPPEAKATVQAAALACCPKGLAVPVLVP
ncbi:MAG: hypothetical protein ACP5NF_10520 [Thermoanaerobaculum sp.]